MNKLKTLLIVLLISVAIVGYAETPTMVNNIPKRFVLVKMVRWEHNCLKLDTRTGEVWFVKGDSNVEKIQLNKCAGIQTVSESNSFDGRFCLHFMDEGGIPWVYVLDSKTGNIWAMEYARRGKSDHSFIQIH